jgi:hypothetical protein
MIDGNNISVGVVVRLLRYFLQSDERKGRRKSIMVCGWCNYTIKDVSYYCRRCGWHLGYNCLKNGRCPKCDCRVEKH